MDKDFYTELYKSLNLVYGDGILEKIGTNYVYIVDKIPHKLQKNLFECKQQLESTLKNEADNLMSTLTKKQSRLEFNNGLWHYGAIPFSQNLPDTVSTIRALIQEL